MFRNVIWDVDGTLFDTYPAISHAFRIALARFGKDAPIELVMELAKCSLSHCLATLAAMTDVPEPSLDQEFDRCHAQVQFADQPPFPAVIDVCQYVLSVSGKNVVVTHRGPAGTNGLLCAHGMNHLFSGSITSTDGYPRKPDPAAFLAAVDRFGLDPRETITVGDRGIDVEAGKKAGLFSCLFTSGSPVSQPDFVFSSYAELLRLLRSTN